MGLRLTERNGRRSAAWHYTALQSTLYFTEKGWEMISYVASVGRKKDKSVAPHLFLNLPSLFLHFTLHLPPITLSLPPSLPPSEISPSPRRNLRILKNGGDINHNSTDIHPAMASPEVSIFHCQNNVNSAVGGHAHGLSNRSASLKVDDEQ